MIFTSFALLSGMVLFSSAAPWSPPAPITHYVNVSNDTAGLIYDPPYIVSQSNGHYIWVVVLTHISSRAPRLETPFRSSSIPRTTLLHSPALTHHALLFMAEPTLACASYLSKYISHRVFSDMSSYHIASLLHRELVTMTSPPGNSLLKMYALFSIPRHVLTDRFIIRQNPSGSIVARLQTRRQATAARAWYSQ